MRGIRRGEPGKETIEESQNNYKEPVELYLESFGEGDLPASTGEVMLYPFEVAVGG
ncbi:MAG: hypothetical protein ABSA09_05055 [Desulfobaccales bacterium]